MDENCKRQKEVERTYGGLLPAVEGDSLGTRYKVQGQDNSRATNGNKLQGRPKTTLSTVFNKKIALIEHPIRPH